MEYMSRGENRASAPAPAGRRKRIDWAARTVRLELFVVLVGSALLLAAVALYLGFSGSPTTSESKQIDSGKYQAVFLNGGATSGSVAYTTYFGHVTKLNSSYLILKDVYYLTTASSSDQSQAANPQLTKLGCQQLHSPFDEMVVNRNQVAFWENLQDSGKVVQAIKQFKQQNPNGPNCSANTSSSTNSTTNTQNTTKP
ncbi:hypothetical protein KW801_01590 [Candidatus Saccharibacteria bacterium]|nr:hypothetical protein [Candidatus Saccharibacteria bacterium]